MRISQMTAVSSLYVSESRGSDEDSGGLRHPLCTMEEVVDRLPDIMRESRSLVVHVDKQIGDGYSFPAIELPLGLSGHIVVVADGAGDSSEDCLEIVSGGSCGAGSSGTSIVVEDALTPSEYKVAGVFVRMVSGGSRGEIRLVEDNSELAVVPAEPFTDVSEGDGYELVTPNTVLLYPSSSIYDTLVSDIGGGDRSLEGMPYGVHFVNFVIKSTNTQENLLRFRTRNSSVCFYGCKFSTPEESGAELHAYSSGKLLFGLDRYDLDDTSGSVAVSNLLLLDNERAMAGYGCSFNGDIYVSFDGTFGGYLTYKTVTVSDGAVPLLLCGDSTPVVDQGWRTPLDPFAERSLVDNSDIDLLAYTGLFSISDIIAYKITGVSVERIGRLSIYVEGGVPFYEDVLEDGTDEIEGVVLTAEVDGDNVVIKATSTSVGEDVVIRYRRLR